MFYIGQMDSDLPIDKARRRGRGAVSNAAGRFEPARSEEGDGWDIPEARPGFRTEVRAEAPRSLITYNSSPDLPFDRSINPYRGCEHGCIYCFARPTHAYLGLSPGLDFETRLVARPEAAQVLRRELRSRKYQVAPIAIGTNTDPYQPIEKEWRVTRSCLEVLQAFQHPVAIVTKGALIERDLDILAPMAEQGLLRVGISLTTLDADLSRRMEPRAPSPARRLRLPLEVSPLWQEWLAEHAPGRAGRIMARLREMHGGKDYDARWGHRMRGEGQYAEMVQQRFRRAARRLGLDAPQPKLRCDLFRVPVERGDQLSLF